MSLDTGSLDLLHPQLSCPGLLKYHQHHQSTSLTHNYAGTTRGMWVDPSIQYANFLKSPWICQQQLVFRCKCCDKPLSRRRPSSAKFEGGCMWILQLNTVHQAFCGRLWLKGLASDMVSLSIHHSLFVFNITEWNLCAMTAPTTDSRFLIMLWAVAEVCYCWGNIIKSKCCFLPGSAVW